MQPSRMTFTKVTSFQPDPGLLEITGKYLNFWKIFQQPSLRAIMTCISLERSIHRDESVFPEPEKFDLARWLMIDDETGKTVLNPDMRHFAYGFGRR